MVTAKINTVVPKTDESAVYNNNSQDGPTGLSTAIIVIVLILGMILVLKWYYGGGENNFKPQLTDKIVVVTGANTGLGFECVKYMAALNAKTIILACRSEPRATEAINKIKKSCYAVENIEFMELDLNNLESIKAFATAFNAKYDKLDILLNNAGIMALPERKQTTQGIEQQVGVNHIGHFHLTNLLLDKVKAAQEGRIVNVSSLAHAWTGKGGLNFDDLNSEKHYDPGVAYGYSKLANVYFTKKLSQKLIEEKIMNVKVVSLHPGVVRTELGRYMANNVCMLFMQKILCFPVMHLFFKSPWQGSQTSLYCCLCPFGQLQSGMYYSDCVIKKETLVDDWQAQADKLWEWSEEKVKEFK